MYFKIMDVQSKIKMIFFIDIILYHRSKAQKVVRIPLLGVAPRDPKECPGAPRRSYDW